MIEGFVRGDAEVIARFARIPGDVRSQLRYAIGRSVLKLQRSVQADKLTGQVLKVRTGLLRRSIGHLVIEGPEFVAGTVSTNVKYARAHEYGFRGQVSVRAHLRLVKTAFGKRLRHPVWVNVAAHTARMNLPERSFLRAALAEAAPAIEAEIARAVAAAVNR